MRPRLRHCPTALLYGLALFVFFSLCFSAGQPTVPKQDRRWKQYRNPTLGYCLTYPSRWLKGDAFDGAGFYIETGVRKYSKPIGEIDITALTSSPDSGDAVTFSLLDDLQQHLDGLKTFERAERMELIEKKEIHLLGDAALLTKDRYYDPQDRGTWLDEVIFVRHEKNLFRLEMECPDDQLARFEPVFNRVVDSFRFDCGASQ